jgi:hypothetical protein
MKNTTFYGMNAKDFLDKVIEKEKAFNETDYNTLNFEEKCEYALVCVHSSAPFETKLSQNDLVNLKSDIIKKALDGDAAGLYYLAKFSDMFGISAEAKRDCLKRSSDMGYTPATVLYLRLCFDAEERYAIARELVGKIPTIEPLYRRCIAIMGCYPTLRNVEGNDKYPHHHALTYDLFLELAKDGEAEAFPWLEIIANRKAKKADTQEERCRTEEECAFWQSVQYMVAEHYYNRGVLKHEKHLGYMLLCGVGCDADVERGAELTIKDMRRASKSLDIDTVNCALLVLDEYSDTLHIQKKIVASLLRGDDLMLDTCIATAKENGTLVEVLCKASSMLYSKIQQVKYEGGNR